VPVFATASPVDRQLSSQSDATASRSASQYGRMRTFSGWSIFMSNALRLQIVRAKPEHAGIVRHLVRAAYAKWIPAIGREPLPMAADYERAIQDHDIDLLYAEGELVALIETIPASDHLFIENIAVAAAYHGRGFGRYLLGHAECKARQAGLDEIRPTQYFSPIYGFINSSGSKSTVRSRSWAGRSSI
jgi:GNAT superfamily N-acetyltransferase